MISVKLADPQFEGQTKTKLGNPPVEGLVKETVNRKLGEFLEENPAEARRIITKAVDAARARDAARKARDLTRRKSALENSTLPGKLADCTVKDPRARRAVHRRGRLRRRLGQAGPRPQHPGGPAAARQDHQRREEPDRQGALQQRDPGADHRDRHRGPRGVRPRGRPLPQGHPDDRRRRRRRPHPHAGADLPLPPDAGADRGGLRLHRQAAALQGSSTAAGDLHREGVRARGAAAPRQAREVRGHRPRRQEAQADRSALAALQPAASRSTRAGRRPLRAEFGHEAIGFLDESQILDEGATTSTAVASCSTAETPRGSRSRPRWSRRTATSVVVKAIQRESGLARTPPAAGAMFTSQRVPGAGRGARASCSSRSGEPPFKVEARRRATTRRVVRRAARGGARARQAGVELQRFKGLGEMNAEQLRETTMDPATPHAAAGDDRRRRDGRPASSPT